MKVREKLERVPHIARATITWGFPLVLLLLSLLVPALRQPMTLASFGEGGLGWWLLVSAVIAAVWIIVEFVWSANLRTPVKVLQADALVGVMWACVMMSLFGWFLRGDDVRWFIIVPWLATFVEACVSVWAAINNAAQKPLVEPQRQG